jgi:putative acetyltransferase
VLSGFQAEVAGLPGEYAPPKGALLLARPRNAEEPLGCVALRPVPDTSDVCEMKRLYVRRKSQGSGLGRALAEAAIAEARRLGYRRICLDTLPSMVAAQGLYKLLGFTHTGTAGSDPAVLLFERDLQEAS